MRAIVVSKTFMQPSEASRQQIPRCHHYWQGQLCLRDPVKRDERLLGEEASRGQCVLETLARVSLLEAKTLQRQNQQMKWSRWNEHLLTVATKSVNASVATE